MSDLLKKHCCHCEGDYFTSIQSLLHLFMDMDQCIYNRNELIWEFLKDDNISNQQNQMNNAKLHKLHEHVTEHNVLYLERENDESTLMKMMTFDDINEEFDGDYHNLPEMNVNLSILYQFSAVKLKTTISIKFIKMFGRKSMKCHKTSSNLKVGKFFRWILRVKNIKTCDDKKQNVTASDLNLFSSCLAQ